jgi:basic membrane lipoprotein Med (substrate-binding protein (PBP1-ABC) superfamily)
MKSEQQQQFNKVIMTLMGTTPLPDGLDLEDMAKKMASFYEGVIAKSKSENTATTFFTTFTGGYLAGYAARLKKEGKTWSISPERN